MAKNEAIAKAIATDPYLKERKSPTAVDQQLYLKEKFLLYVHSVERFFDTESRKRQTSSMKSPTFSQTVQLRNNMSS